MKYTMLQVNNKINYFVCFLLFDHKTLLCRLNCAFLHQQQLLNNRRENVFPSGTHDFYQGLLVFVLLNLSVFL